MSDMYRSSTDTLVHIFKSSFRHSGIEIDRYVWQCGGVALEGVPVANVNALPTCLGCIAEGLWRRERVLQKSR